MADNIHLDLNNNAEFLEKYSKSERWQQQATNALCRHLNYLGQQARIYAKQNPNNSPALAQSHNTIFISGDRGAGKTVFLKNAQQMWQEKLQDSDITLHFSGMIDPTLLMVQDSFTNVIVAHLYNEVEKKINKNKDKDLISTFYTDLRQLSDALNQGGDTCDRMGLDRIIKYSSGIQVEQFFHKFVSTCINILNVDAIILPIDDVDMSLARAFEVLDVVRRMLGCPFIIPIVSGDENLYHHMIKKQFMQDTLDKSKVADKCTDLSEKLRDSYLTKVFPNQFRISLLGADKLRQLLKIKEGEKSYTFFDYEKALYRTFFTSTNGEENSRDYPKPSNAREITQFIRMLPPSKLDKTPEWDEWESLRIWGHSKKHGALFTNAIAAQTLLDAKESSDYRLSKLLPFNPKSQSKLALSWATKDFVTEQLNAIENLKEEGAKQANKFILESASLGKVSRSMPFLEFYTLRMSMSSTKLEDMKKNNSDFYHLYTFKDYYGKQGNQIHKVFFSRAFELLASSLLVVCHQPQQSDKKEFKSLVSEVMATPPFYCIHALNPTKYISVNVDEIDDEDNESLADVEEDPAVELFSEQFATRIEKWAIKYQSTLTSISPEQLISLLHAVFNKVFTQLHLLRENHGNLDKKNQKSNQDGANLKENLADTIMRFEYITINAFASFLKSGNVPKSNIAIDARVETIRDYQGSFKSSEHVFTRNVGFFVDLSTGEPKDESSVLNQLMAAICAHPVFIGCFKLTDETKKVLLQIPPFATTTADNETKQKKLSPSPNAKKKQINNETMRQIKSLFGAKTLDELISKIDKSIDTQAIFSAKQLVGNYLKTKNYKVKDLSHGYQDLCKILEDKLHAKI